MKKWVLLVCSIIVMLTGCQTSTDNGIPKPTGFVNDFTGKTLTADQVAILEAKIKAFKDSTSNEIAVVIMQSLDGKVLEDYTIKIAESWGVGVKGKDNGVLLAFFMDDKEDRIEVGYGLEEKLPDIVCNWILKDEVQPNFKDEKYYEGISAAVDKIMFSITGKGSYQKQVAIAMKEEKQNNNALIFFAILAFIAGILGYAHWSVSGITGGIGAPIVWFLVFGAVSVTIGVIAVIIGIVGGLIVHFLMSAFFGGGVSGSDFGEGALFVGGGDGGGGGGGFGGGSFGGGGASGGW
jgi:uncharacterized protein